MPQEKPREAQETPDQPLVSSGTERHFSTGAVRDGAGAMKGRWDLLPFYSLQKLAVHFEKGASRYEARNWEKGIPCGEYLNSAMRHLWKWWLGHKDEDHLVAFVWNAMCLLETHERIKAGYLPQDLDNRPFPMDGSAGENKKVT